MFKERPSKKLNGEICRALRDRGGSIVECGKVAITKFDENLSSGKREPDSEI